MLLIRCVVLLITIMGPAAWAAQVNEDPFLQRARAYADLMLAQGRDRYGAQHSPLFASALDRTSLKIGRFPGINGVREQDRATTGSNPYHHTDLYQVMFALTELTADPRYARAANQALQFFVNTAQHPQTGFFAWGEHAFWDFHTEQVGGRAIHEIQGAWPFWDQWYAINPHASRRFVLGLWQHQIANQQTGDFSRHAHWNRHAPGSGAEFPRYAGQMIEMWADAYARSANTSWKQRQTMLQAIDVVLGRMEANQQTPSGHLLAGTDKNHRRISWPGSNLELARCCWLAAERVPAELAQRMRSMALRLDEQFLALPHAGDFGEIGFVATVDSQTGQPRSRSSNKPYTVSWASGYGFGTHASMARRCAARYQQLRHARDAQQQRLAAAYRQYVLACATHYLSSDPRLQDLLTPAVFAEVGMLLLAAYDFTHNQAFLQRAQVIGRLAEQHFFDDFSALPKASNQHQHYEAITGGPSLVLLFIQLHQQSAN